MFDAVTFCVTLSDPVISTFPFTSSLADADVVLPTLTFVPSSNSEPVVSVVEFKYLAT